MSASQPLPRHFRPGSIPVIATEVFEGVTTEDILAWIMAGREIAEVEDKEP